MDTATTASTATPSPRKMKKLRYILPREDLEIDTCLRVFGTEFQVHSEVLKRRSAFFKKFFDSADRDDHDNTRGSFKYSFKTQMDEFQWDGDEPCWRLIPESAPETIIQCTRADSWMDDKEETFGRLVNAIYKKQCIPQGKEDLRYLVMLAEYYGTLPRLSKSLRGPASYQGIRIDPEILVIACKLRNAELFRECMILEAGYWALDYMPSTDPELPQGVHKMVIQARGGIALKMAEVSENILLSSRANVFGTFMANHTFLNNEESMPAYYRRLLDSSVGSEVESKVRRCLAPILKNNLRFPTSVENTEAGFGKGTYLEFFLCAEFAEDVPWDTDEKDW